MHPTLLIGLDGATFNILDPLMADGVMPCLKKLSGRGARADLMSTVNPLTPPAWISMTTGRTPGNHGVFDFIWSEERQKDVYFTLYNFRDIACETIWSMVSRQGGRVCSLNFPMMAPPPEVNGFIVPGMVSWKHLRRNIHPQELFHRLKEMPGFDAREMAWDFELEKKAEKGVDREEYEHWITFHIKRERQWFEIARHIMKNDPCDLTAVLFDGVDKLLHIAFRYLYPGAFPENPTDFDHKIRSLCLQYFRELDGFIGELVELAGPSARIFFTSDHGFGPTEKVFRINSWLDQNGYLAWKDTTDLAEKDRNSVERLIDRHFVYLDWDKTTAYARTTTSNGVFIRVANDNGQAGIPAHEYEAFRDGLKRKLEDVKDPRTGEKLVKKVLTKEEAYPGVNNRLAPDLTLVMEDHSFASIVNKNPFVVTRPEVTGTHYPEGIFIATGPGISEGATLPSMNIMDVSSCLMYSLGLPVPNDLEGVLPAMLFTAGHMEKNPPVVGRPTEPPAAFIRQDEAKGMAEDEKILDQLKMLGYME